ncbi:predicted cobalamin biosynthesis protein (CbiX-like) [Methanocella arvoryzae MRE50]|uniref:Predicted cobalamin biosynthesis protein (CbiX-like) n=2 Tax=Methanocella TaxID=570266 RepID=Q0W1A7_METAR|nr:predicted cobalamin biosynthesis protein (CbiX-like) [Methanocella arvoryzae MRE50]
MEHLSEESRKLTHTHENDPHGADTEKLASVIRAAGYDVEVGYLDFSLPTIADAVVALTARGHKKLVFACAPGLMMRSSHSLLDVPEVLREIKEKNPGLEMLYAMPGMPFELIARAFVKKVNAASGAPSDKEQVNLKAIHPGTGVVLIAHGDVPHDFIVRNAGVMADAETHAHRWSEMVKDWPRSEENDPNYYDTIVLKVKLREMFWPVTVEVGYLEFASPDIDEAFGKLLAAGARKIVFCGGTGFFDRSSHTLIDIPEAIEKLKARHPDIEMVYAYPDVDLVMSELARAVVFKIEQAINGQVLPL